MAALTFRKKKQPQSRVFFGLIFYVYTNVDNRERARASQLNTKKTNFGGEEMWNASGQQGENERQWKIKANMNTGNKILGKHIGQFLQKIMCNSEVWRFSRAKQRQGKDKLQVQFVLIFFLLDLLVLKPYSFFVYKYH